MKTNKSVLLALSAAVVALAAVASPAMAQDPAGVPGHPRVNEVNQRLENQQDRIQAGVADGQINAKQATRDEARDAKIAQQESKDEAKNGGHLTKREQRKLNKSLNRNSADIHRQRAGK